MDLTVRGRTTLSGKDVCMLEHIPLLLKKGFSHFRIDTSVGSDEYFNEAGSIYREAIDLIKTGIQKENPEIIKNFLDQLKNHSPRGFCNGYYFGKSGSDYVEAPQ